MPKVDQKTNKVVIRYADQRSGLHPYTEKTVAQFLGWVKADFRKLSRCTLVANAVCPQEIRISICEFKS